MHGGTQPARARECARRVCFVPLPIGPVEGRLTILHSFSSPLQLRNTSLPINATRPPPLALGESGGLPSTEESEASVTPLENLTREAVDAEFARVLSQEGGVPRPSPLARHLSHKLDYGPPGPPSPSPAPPCLPPLPPHSTRSRRPLFLSAKRDRVQDARARGAASCRWFREV